MWRRKPTMAASAWLVLLYLMTAAATTLSPTRDSMELSEDSDLMADLALQHTVSCPKPMCECFTAGSGGVTARCRTLDFEGQRFEGIINHLEVTNAPEILGGLFLANHTLSSLGLRDLTTVKITNSSIKALNVNTFSDLKDLIDVDLSDNRIMYLRPDVFHENGMLRKLLLRGNPLVAQVMQNGYLLSVPSLTELDLSRCDMSTLSNDTFSRMTHLEHLWLAGNNLITLPAGVLEPLSLLEELDLSDNLFTSISSSMFTSNADLTDLHLRNNSISSLSGVIIPGLDTLDVSQNFFEIIDETTFAGFPDLTNLNVSGNAVQRVDSNAFSKLVMLQFLDLSGNDIAGPLPRDVFYSNDNLLETLSLSDNPRMGGLPKDGFSGMFSALYQLDLSYTGIRHLDENSFLGMDYLSILYLQGNFLVELQPEVLHRLSKLTNLDLSDNRLTSLDPKTFQTNSFLRRLDLSGNPLATVSPLVFANTPSLRWLDLSRCRLTSLWVDGPASPATLAKKVLLRKLQHLNVAANRIETLRVSELELTGAPSVLDISNNPLKCSKELHYLINWLVNHSVEPRTERRLSGLQNDLAVPDTREMGEDSLRTRWAAVYDAVCGPRAFDTELAKLQKNILASDTSSVPTVSQADLDDINFVLGNKNLITKTQEEEDESEDSYTDADDEDSEDDDDDDDDDDDEEDDDEDDEEDDEEKNGNEDYTAIFDHDVEVNPKSSPRTSPYFWPVITIGVSVVTIMLVLANVVICVVRRRRARRHARYQSPMFRTLGNLPPQPKTFGGIPGSFIKTKKDGGFVYKKLYEETTTPNPPVYFPQARTFKFPLDPSDLQGSNADPSRV